MKEFFVFCKAIALHAQVMNVVHPMNSGMEIIL